MSPPMISKEAARYTNAGGREHCSLCRHFSPRRGGRCARVLGDISPRGWCRLFSREMRGLVADASSFNGGGGPALGLDFMTPGVLDPRITFTRASTATYFDSAGVLRTATTNAPRWDYDPATLALRGLLIEEARTNTQPYSADLTVVGWLKTDVTATVAAGIAPDGTNTMQRLAETATNALHYLWSLSAVPASVSLTQSVFLKMQQVRYVQMFLDSGGAVGAYATFDLQAGTITGPLTAYGGATLGTATIVPVGNGVYRCAITTTIGASTSARFGLILATVPSGGFAGDSHPGNTANGLLVWGAQVEAGAFASSYIPTTSAVVTRAVEVCQIPTGSWFGPSALSVLYEIIPKYPSGKPIGGICDNDFNNAFFLDFGDGTNFVASRAGPGGATASLGAPNTANMITKVATTYTPTLATICGNGGVVASSAGLASLPLTTATRITLGNYPWDPTAAALNGWLRRFGYWSRVLTNAELQTVTTP